MSKTSPRYVLRGIDWFGSLPLFNPRVALVFAVLTVVVGPSRGLLADELAIDFNRQIRPIFSDKCFACHGPDDANREGGFRLDVHESAMGEADSGQRPIVAGSPEQSEIVARIATDDEGIKMPPPDAEKALDPEEIETIVEWIRQGAPWQDHWSLTPVRRPDPPSVEWRAWPRNAIDRFILARLEAEPIAPSEQADRITLLRRVTLDLTGLPPSLEEVDAFLADHSDRAYERVVDRLLASKRYGEHMGRFWLDAARYGDTHGLHLDNYREMWPYRDWVVRAFNDNMPFDQFTLEQLAGDLLPDPSLDQLVATGFNRCHVSTNEGGSIKEEVYVRNVVDRVVTVGTVFMGLTLDCSRCHDHKFDPLTMNDFYSLFAYFNSLDGNSMDGNRKDHAPVARVPSEEQNRLIASYKSRIEALQSKLQSPWPEVDELQRRWEAEFVQDKAPVGGNEIKEETKTNLIALGDWYTVGPFSDNQRYLNKRKHGPEGRPIDLMEEFKLATNETVKWKRRSDWVDGKAHSDLPGSSAANFLYRSITTTKPEDVSVSLGSDDGIRVYLNGKRLLSKNVTRGVAPDQDNIELPLKQGKNHLLMKILNYGGGSGFYFAIKTDIPIISGRIMEIVRIDPNRRSEEQRLELRNHYRNKVAKTKVLKEAQSELANLRKKLAEVERQIPTTLIWRERKEPRPAYYLYRGEYDQRGEQRERRTPETLPPMDEDLPNNRLGFAKWLVDPSHPLTARVAVNRFWQQLFGAGIVKTSEDFGSQGERPSHPRLLDWLAAEFIESGWDVKKLMKKMVMSSTYRQSSRIRHDIASKDPENRLLASSPRFRLDAEVLRDQALFFGGLLVERIGGPSVKPVQPPGLWYAVGYSGSNTVRFVADKGPDKVHRRTLYTFIKRTAPPPQMSTLDAPSRESCSVRRERTNTPLQALMMFNDPQFFEAARGLAERTMRDGGDDVPSCASFMFRVCTSREPTEQELSELVRAVHDDRAKFRKNQDAASKVIRVGAIPPDQKLNEADLAAWTMTANMLLNMDEVVCKN